MNKIVINDGATRYERISKREARKLFVEGKSFYIIAHKMRPGFPFSMGMTVDSAHYHAEGWKGSAGFELMVTNFCWYNANSHETGTYAAFYTAEAR